MRCMEFELTEYHIKLLTSMYVEFYDSSYDGAPAIDMKRPYGNSFVAGDVAEILGWEFDQDDELSDEMIENAMTIHRETAIALQIVLCCKTFEPGLYKKETSWRSLSWRKI